MKVTAALGLLSLLTPAVVGRPTVQDDEGDTLPQKSRVTAFVVDEKGNPSVECWEFDNMVEDMKVRKNDGSIARGHSMNIAKKGDLDGLDILTWPAASPIWPDPSEFGGDEMRGNYVDLLNTFNLFTIQGGLINFKFSIFAKEVLALDNGLPDHTFSLENGDDWFYFEDKYTGSDESMRADAVEPPFLINSVSATNTEVLRLRFGKRPGYKVLHKGGCSFTGISTPESSSSRRKSHKQKNPLVKQSTAEL